MPSLPPVCIISSGVPTRFNRNWGSPLVVEDVIRTFRALSIFAYEIILNEVDKLIGTSHLAFSNGYWMGADTNSLVTTFLERHQIPFIGGPASSYTFVNRVRLKAHLTRHSISTPRYVVVDADADVPDGLRELSTPWVVKTPFDGNSAGVSTAEDFDAVRALLNRVGGPLVVEEWSKSREFTVCFLGNRDERRFFISEIDCAGVFDNSMKTSRMGAYCAPVRDTHLRARLEQTASALLAVLPINDWGRIDVLYNQVSDEHLVIDVNFLPGLQGLREPRSLFFSTVALETSMTYEDFLYALVESALKRLNECSPPA